ncbi:Protein Mis18-alpha [Coemansia sp. RSA 2703]|nr:Protein Mis18-alpha [Coemansia sp. RSA 2703]KAJ2378206.1 Protein Mis18-alpha [Coemansia sp. RSA 2607]KAJ2398152.1 Protein Mis18-alpha [Coemansia sp. RSA 2603]
MHRRTSNQNSHISHTFNNGIAEQHDTGDSDDAINGPIVFSCAKCRTILGDTFAYVSSLPEYNLFGLQAVPSSVVCAKSKKTTDEGIFHELSCAECQAVIGRRYLTTIEGMDSIRNTFALDISKVLTYELGKCLKGEDLAKQTLPPPEFYTSVSFHEDMTMVKNNVTAIAARLQKLEQALARNTATSPRTPVNPRKRQSASGAELLPVDPSKRFGR